jgi:single-stranded DNA-binding protein
VEIWGQAERAVELLEPGDEVMLSGKLKYKSVLDSKTQQKTSKLIVSSWGIQQRSESAQDERTDVDPSPGMSDDVPNAPRGNEERPLPKKRAWYPKQLQQPWEARVGNHN